MATVKHDQTILIVDDEKSNLLLLSTLLSDEANILVAKNGSKAIELAYNEKPDLILLDVVMEGVDGHEVIKALKQEESTREIGVIFVSSLNTIEDEERGLKLGALDYIAKPFHPAIVRARVQNHLQLARQKQLLEIYACIDGLTGVANRRRFEEALRQEWQRCLRYGRPISLVMMDVDYFKPYNDYYGHMEGDMVLRRVAETLTSIMRRPNDLVARYGGEEFALVVVENSAEECQALVESACRAIEEMEIPHEGSDASEWVTISAGGVTVIPNSDNNSEMLLRVADGLLYQAKRQGRNQMCWEVIKNP